MARPICVHCGKPYGQRDTRNEYVIWRLGTEKPAYTGNHVVVSEQVWHVAPHAVTGSMSGVPYGENDNVTMRKLWDGQTWWGGYEPFCTLRCALDYARRAYARSKQQKVRLV